MRVAIFDRVEPPVPSELPLRLTETCSRKVNGSAYLQVNWRAGMVTQKPST